MEKVKEPGLESKHQGTKQRTLITKDNGRTSNKLRMLRKETDSP